MHKLYTFLAEEILITEDWVRWKQYHLVVNDVVKVQQYLKVNKYRDLNNKFPIFFYSQVLCDLDSKI